MRLGEDAKRSVVFFGKTDPMTGEIVYGGTGFLVGYEGQGARLPYLVTCRIADKLQKDFVIREQERWGRANSQRDKCPMDIP
jgi:hypothetical protein